MPRRARNTETTSSKKKEKKENKLQSKDCKQACASRVAVKERRVENKEEGAAYAT